MIESVKKYNKVFLSSKLGGAGPLLLIFQTIKQHPNTTFQIRQNGQEMWLNLEEFSKEDAELLYFLAPDVITTPDYKRRNEHQKVGDMIDNLDTDELNDFMDIVWPVFLRYFSDKNKIQ